jgi:hypothetical protein
VDVSVSERSRRGHHPGSRLGAARGVGADVGHPGSVAALSGIRLTQGPQPLGARGPGTQLEEPLLEGEQVALGLPEGGALQGPT